MIYDISNSVEKKKACSYFDKIIEGKGRIEVKTLRRPKTISNKKYLGVCCRLYAEHFDFNLDEAKTILKRMHKPMIYSKRGHKFLKSSNDLDEDEISEFIDFVRTHANEEGLYIETPEEYLFGL